MSEDRFAAYKGVKDITIKKGPSGFGFMIIEGRHNDTGHGIYVSDLQKNSPADLAGLQIGDLILAVNRDSVLHCGYQAAAAKVKNTEGVMVLTVCTPKSPDASSEEPSGSGGAVAGPSRASSGNQNADPRPGASRPQTPRPLPSPVRAEPALDFATAPIVPNQNSVIEVNTANDILGLVLIGGSDTMIAGPAAIVLDILPNGAIAKDGRLKTGDQIIECNGVVITADMTHERRSVTVKQRALKLRLTVFRPDPMPFDEIEVELVKKNNRAFGFPCVAFMSRPGVYVGDLIPGSVADLDGRLQKGDLVISLDGRDITNSDFLTAAITVKICGNRLPVKVKRFKVIR